MKIKSNSIDKIVQKIIKEELSSSDKTIHSKSGRINKGSVQDIDADVNKIYKGLTMGPQKTKTSQLDVSNKNNLNLTYRTEPSQEFKDRTKREVEGRDSDEEDNSGNKTFYKNEVAKNKQLDTAKKILKKSGLASRTYPDDAFDDKGKHSTNESTIKRLRYKRTVFVNEEFMFSLIPQNYKVPGNKFIMEDAEGTEFLIEWKEIKLGNNMTDYGYILERKNDAKFQENAKRIIELMDPVKTKRQKSKIMPDGINEILKRERTLNI